MGVGEDMGWGWGGWSQGGGGEGRCSSDSYVVGQFGGQVNLVCGIADIRPNTRIHLRTVVWHSSYGEETGELVHPCILFTLHTKDKELLKLLFSGVGGHIFYQSLQPQICSHLARNQETFIPALMGEVHRAPELVSRWSCRVLVHCLVCT